jgi:hypothetical protein
VRRHDVGPRIAKGGMQRDVVKEEPGPEIPLAELAVIRVSRLGVVA